MMVGTHDAGRTGWSAEKLLVAWGEWHEHGRLKSAGARRCGGDIAPATDIECLAYEYVSGTYIPPTSGYLHEFDRARVALDHVYARALPLGHFRVIRAPGRSRYGALMDLGWADLVYICPDWRVCELVLQRFKECLQARMAESPFDPSKWDPDRWA